LTPVVSCPMLHNANPFGKCMVSSIMMNDTVVISPCRRTDIIGIVERELDTGHVRVSRELLKIKVKMTHQRSS